MRASPSLVEDPASGSYCMSTAVNSRGRNVLPPTVRFHAPSWKTTRGAWSFIDAGNRSKKMSSASEMWLSAENTSVPEGRPTDPDACPCRSFGGPKPSGG